jgi:hypothetical protein
MAQDRFPSIKALATASLLGERIKAFFDFGGQAQRKHGTSLQLHTCIATGFPCQGQRSREY